MNVCTKKVYSEKTQSGLESPQTLRDLEGGGGYSEYSEVDIDLEYSEAITDV